MRQCLVYDDRTGHIAEVAWEHIPAASQQEHLHLWVDITAPDDADFTWLTTVFQVHPLALEDMRNQLQRAKIDSYENNLFIVLRTIDFHQETNNVDSHQLDLLVGRRYLVTVHRADVPWLAGVRHRWSALQQQPDPIPHLLYLLLDTVVDAYFPVIDQLGDSIDDVDTRIFQAPDSSALQAIFALRRTLLTLRRTLGPMRDMLNELFRYEQNPVLDLRQSRVYYADVFDHILRLSDFVDTYRDMLSGSLEAYQSSLANRMNERVQWLTIAATILATATVITGFYGMNLRGLGINAEWAYGGHAVLALLVIVTLVEIWLFHRNGWL
jgi:magnesium transporter